MKDTHNKLTCLFGHHDYDEELTVDKGGYSIHLCKHCKRCGYRDSSFARKILCDYDEKGNKIYEKWYDGFEIWLDYGEKGNCIHEKRSDGGEWWKANNGVWVYEKPKNWRYEK